MATTRSRNWLEDALDAGRTFFHQKLDQIRDALARRRVYRETYLEFSMLSDRNLADLGIPRSNIRYLALEAAYGL